MPSFDIVSEVDKTEVKNAIDQTNKEVSTSKALTQKLNRPN
jgi:uncharacterized protein YajQ (UPF0234 family)